MPAILPTRFNACFSSTIMSCSPPTMHGAITGPSCFQQAWCLVLLFHFSQCPETAVLASMEDSPCFLNVSLQSWMWDQVHHRSPEEMDGKFIKLFIAPFG
ncbi:hypothetical protein GOODEAATRI_023983 [Goodea atripinnis]|uniref:Uncharacterized protein n=1 Tax=Goodea atripinnis TaxID=208336 RepID=A0ABV0NMR4_9TELE